MEHRQNFCHLAFDSPDAINNIPCSTQRSEIVPLLCSNHFTFVYGLELRPIIVPLSVRLSLGVHGFDTIGYKLFARSPNIASNYKEGDEICSDGNIDSDIVFETGDTIIVFGEYANAAFAEERRIGQKAWDHCVTNNSRYHMSSGNALVNFTNQSSYVELSDSLMAQRCFSRCLSSLRISHLASVSSTLSNNTEANINVSDLFYTDARNRIFENLKEAIENVGKSSENIAMLIPSSVRNDRDKMCGNEPYYLCGPFRLSKPLTQYYQMLLSNGALLSTKMPWTIEAAEKISTPTYANAYEEFIAKKIQIFRFRTVLTSSLRSMWKREYNNDNSLLVRNMSTACAITREESYIASVNAQIRLDEANAACDESCLKRFLCRPLLNQYDDSYPARCHRYFLPLSTELLSAKVLQVIAKLVIPMSTVRTPSKNSTATATSSAGEELTKFLFDEMISSPSMQTSAIFDRINCLRNKRDQKTFNVSFQSPKRFKSTLNLVSTTASSLPPALSEIEIGETVHSDINEDIRFPSQFDLDV